MTPTHWIRVARLDELSPGQVRTLDAGDQPVAVCRAVDGQIYAVEDVCTHDDGPLGEGELDGFEIECPRHGARFDIRTGKVLCMPAVVDIRTFPVRVEGDQILVGLEGED